jgi:hypothetical protein
MGQMGQMGQMSQMSFQHFLKLLDVPTTEQNLSETRRLNRFLESIHVYTREQRYQSCFVIMKKAVLFSWLKLSSRL